MNNDSLLTTPPKGGIWLLRASVFLMMIGLSTLWGLQSLWMKAGGLGEAKIGELIELITAVSLISSLIFGAVADRTRQPRWICIIGLLGFGVSVAFLGRCETETDFYIFSVLRGFTFPMMYNMLPLMAVTLLDEQSGSKNAGSGYGKYRIYGSYGFFVSTGLSCLLAKTNGGAVPVWVFDAAACVTALAIVPLFFFHCTMASRTKRSGLKAVLFKSGLGGLYLAAFFYAMGDTAMYLFTPTYAKSLGASDSFVLGWTSMMGAIAIISLPLCGRLVDRTRPKFVLFLAFIAQPLRVAGYGFCESYEWLVVPQLLHAFSWAGYELAIILYVTRVAGAGRKGTALAVHTSITMCGMMCASRMAGYLAEFKGYPMMYLVMAAFTWVGLVIFCISVKPFGKQAEGAAPSREPGV